MTTKQLATSIVALAMTFSLPMSALAHGGGDDDHSLKAGGDVRVQQEDHIKGFGFFNNMNRSCTALDHKIDKIISRFDNNTDPKVNGYLRLKTRVADFEARAHAAGLDTTTLQAHMAVLNTKIDQFNTDYTAYINALKTLRTFTCGGSDGQFQAQLQVARNLLAQARTSGIAVKDYFKTTVRVDIENLWTQLQANLSLDL